MNNLFIFRDTDLSSILRMLLAFILGGVVGFQREWVRRPAGLRTHILVCTGSACFTLASIYGFQGYGGPVDPSRLAAQIITGIGFLGAGTIFRTGSIVRGLTTASSIWITAAIGILAGVGMIALAVFATILAWFALTVLKLTEVKGPGRQQGSGEPPAASTGDDLD
jgi:putative Mg2+ transporter-C (MgtC) family protein